MANIKQNTKASAELELLTVREASEFLRLSTHTLRHHLSAGRLPSLRLGGKRLLLKSDLVKLLERNRQEAGAPAELRL